MYVAKTTDSYLYTHDIQTRLAHRNVQLSTVKYSRVFFIKKNQIIVGLLKHIHENFSERFRLLSEINTFKKPDSLTITVN